MNNLKQQGTQAFIWDFFGKMATHGMGLVISIFLARLLEPSDFGLVAIVMVFIGISSKFTSMGLGGALVQRRRLHPVHYSSVFYFNVVVALILTIVFFFTAPFISNFYENEQLLPMIQVMSIYFILDALSSVQNALLQKQINFKRMTKISFSASLISGIIGVGLAFWGAGVWSLIVQSMSMSFIYNILVWRISSWQPTAKFSWKALTQLWAFGFRMFLVRLLNTIYTRMDYMIIGKLFSIDTLGYYQRAKSLNMLAVQYSSGSLMTVMFPILTKVQNDLPRFQNIIVKSLGIVSFISFMLYGGLFLVADELIVILFSQKWLISADYFKLLALSAFAFPINAILVNTLSSRGNSKAFLRMAIYKKIIAFSNLVIAFSFGIEGFLYGLVLVALINTSITIFMVSRELEMQKWKFYKPIISQASITLISAYITYRIVANIVSAEWILFLLKGVLFVVVYLSINWLVKPMPFIYFIDQFRNVMSVRRKK